MANTIANCVRPVAFRAITAKENITNSNIKCEIPFNGNVALGEPNKLQLTTKKAGAPIPSKILENMPFPVCIPQYPYAINTQISKSARIADRTTNIADKRARIADKTTNIADKRARIADKPRTSLIQPIDTIATSNLSYLL
ncbi:hypothetical protein LSPCS325_26540 [Lysinibacillus sp. CTST325]